MSFNIIATRQSLDVTQADSLQALFDSPGFRVLKEVVAAKCAEHQAEAMNEALTLESPFATESATEALKSASRLNGLLELLDEIQSNRQEWGTVKLEPRR